MPYPESGPESSKDHIEFEKTIKDLLFEMSYLDDKGQSRSKPVITSSDESMKELFTPDEDAPDAPKPFLDPETMKEAERVKNKIYTGILAVVFVGTVVFLYATKALLS